MFYQMALIQLSQYQEVSMGNDWFELADPNHFWIQWRFQILRRLIGNTIKPGTGILEIGCGNGLVMWQMEKYFQVFPDGCDLNKKALETMMPVHGKVYLYDIFDLHPDLLGRYDIVMMLDVLEHIKDDHSFMQTASRYLKPGGLMLVGVPAHPGLFSEYDRLVGHVRRYRRKELRRVFESAGFLNPEIHNWGLSMLPLIFIRKIYLRYIAEEKVISSGFKPPHPLVNRLMLALMRAETRLFRRVPAGISLMAAGRESL
jgi:SAM-dependent methyltransferase